MKQIFRVKILRQKLISIAIIVLLVEILLLTAGYFRNRQKWLTASWEDALDLQEQIEKSLEREEQFLDIALNAIYPCDSLLTDLKNLMNSCSLEEYMQKRYEDSKNTSQAIRSFPIYFKTFIRNYDSTLQQLVIRGSGNDEMICFEGENIAFQFDLPKESTETEMNISQNIVLERTIYDTTSNYRQLGRISFFYDVQKLLESEKQPGRLAGAALIDENSNRLFLHGSEEVWGEQMESFLQQNLVEGAVSDGWLQTVYYRSLASEEYGYRLVAFVDTKLLLKDNLSEMIPFFVVILMFGALFLFLFFLNIKYDYSFVKHIFESIESVNRGEFEESARHMLKRYRANEYGHIAKELDEMCLRLKRYIAREYQLKIKQQETEMRALQNQINPHFLYNTLEIIRSVALIHNDRQAADAMSALGALYRDMVKGKQECTIGDEISLLEKYLKLMQVTSMDNFIWQIHIDPDMRKVRTVKFWMQPLSENFFAHGFDGNRMNVLVIEGKRCREGWLLEITDNGKGILPKQLEDINKQLKEGEDSDSGSIGLSNVYMRLRFFYGEKLTMRLDNQPEGGAKVSVRIPAEGVENV